MTPGSPSAPELKDDGDDPGAADRDAGPARRGRDRAAVRHARGPQDPAARVRQGARRATAPRASTARSRTGSPPTATARDGRRRDARRDRPRPVRLRQERRRDRRGARPQPRPAQVADHRLQHDRRRVRARGHATCNAAIGELPHTLRASYTALGALNEAFPPLRALAHELRPGVQSSGPTLDVAQPFIHELRGLVSEPELRGLAADLRPTVPDLAQLVDRSVPLSREVRRAVELQQRGHPPVDARHGAGQAVPGQGPGLRGGARSRCPASPARAARPTPTARGSASSPPAARTS